MPAQPELITKVHKTCKPEIFSAISFEFSVLLEHIQQFVKLIDICIFWQNKKN
jgi:hypothetical protein